jgi:uncharacterized protein
MDDIDGKCVHLVHYVHWSIRIRKREKVMLQDKEGYCILTVKVIPKAKKTEVVGVEGDVCKIRVAAIPDKGKANAALIRFLAKKLGIRQNEITVIRGHTSRLKQLTIASLSREEIEALLIPTIAI